MIIFGMKSSLIETFEVPYDGCDYCVMSSSHTFSVFGNYLHIFWIPLFPTSKSVYAECNHCKRTLELKDFSPELLRLYQEHRSPVRRPIWHWLGLGLVAIFFVIALIIGLNDENDPRYVALKQDLDALTTAPTMASDSVSFKIKQLFDETTPDELKPDQIKYLTRTKDDKVLILVQIPELKKVEKDVRTEALNLIEMVSDNQADLIGKQKFIGVYGKYNMMLTRTPTGTMNGSLVIPDDLYDFYEAKTKK